MNKKFWLSLILAIGLILPITHSPGNHLPVFTPTIAYSDTGYVDPNGDISAAWHPIPYPGTHYTTIDDGTRQNSTPDLTDYLVISGGMDPYNNTDTFDMSTLTVSSVTNVTVWAYGKIVGSSGNTIKTQILMNGTPTTETALSFTNNTASWQSASFDGNWNQTDLNTMQVKLHGYTPAFGGTLYIYAMYCVVSPYSGGGGGVTATGKVIMISDDGEGAPSYGYNYDYVSVYPPVQNDTYVKATSTYPPNNEPYYTTDPTKPLTGWGGTYTWVSDLYNITNQRFHIDLGVAKIVTRIYYENYHQGGTAFDIGVQNFTFYGSNTEGDFTDLVYADTGDWVQLTTSQSIFDQHVAADQPDPKYITVTNTTAYRYYGFKFVDNWGDDGHLGVRRIELQTAR